MIFRKCMSKSYGRQRVNGRILSSGLARGRWSELGCLSPPLTSPSLSTCSPFPQLPRHRPQAMPFLPRQQPCQRPLLCLPQRTCCHPRRRSLSARDASGPWLTLPRGRLSRAQVVCYPQRGDVAKIERREEGRRGDKALRWHVSRRVNGGMRRMEMFCEWTRRCPQSLFRPSARSRAHLHAEDLMI